MTEPIRIIHENDVPWSQGRKMIIDGVERGVHNRIPLMAHENGPWLSRAKYDPFVKVDTHAHPTNEIIYVTSGELTVGDTTYGPGTVIGIQAFTRYGPLTAGPDGAEFLLIMERDPKRTIPAGEVDKEAQAARKTGSE